MKVKLAANRRLKTRQQTLLSSSCNAQDSESDGLKGPRSQIQWHWQQAVLQTVVLQPPNPPFPNLSAVRSESHVGSVPVKLAWLRSKNSKLAIVERALGKPPAVKKFPPTDSVLPVHAVDIDK